jgi:hypothetical protein
MIAHEILPFKADWRSDIKLELRWSTVVNQAITGAEKRSGHWQYPHRAFDYRMVARSGAEATAIRSRLYSSAGRIFGVPYWPDAVALTTSASVGATELRFTNPGDLHFASDLPAILIHDHAYEYVIPSGIGGGYINTSTALQNDWPVGATLCPLFQGIVDGNSVTVSAETGESAEVSLRLVEDNRERLPDNNQDFSVFPEYKGLTVFTAPHNWQSRFKDQTEIVNDVFVSLGGYRETIRPMSEPRKILHMSATFFSRDDIASLVSFFCNHKGRLYPFWYPSPYADIILDGPYMSGASSLRVQGKDAYRLFGDGYNHMGRYLFFAFPDGSTACREVVGWESGGLVMNLDVPLETAWDYRTTRVSYLHLARFDKDVLGLNYTTSQIADLQVSISTLPQTEVPN